MTDSSPNEPATSTFNEFPPSSSPSSLKALPRPLSIRHSQSYEPAPRNPAGSPVNELRGVRSSVSLNLLTFATPLQQRPPQETGQRSQALPSRSSFSNPFRKLQTTFGNSGKRSLDLGSSNNLNGTSNGGNSTFDRIVPPSSSASPPISWKSRGAEMFSKPWGRNRKNSEPLLKSTAGSVAENVIFGVDLEEAIRVSHIPSTPPVPAVLYRCAEFLEAKGVDEIGLYRIPGSHVNVQKLKRIFDTGRDYNLMAMDDIDVNDIATLLKLYLRELPSPLLPAVLLEQFQSLLTTDQHICHTLRGILLRLPRQNYTVLSFLCHHLSKIAAHAENTKMTVSNLGVVFAPTLAIGSVLFRALLGGFYDGSDSPENREMGLKIVWGGLHQDGYGMQEWPEDDGEGVEAQGGEEGPEAGDEAKYEYAEQDRVQDPYLEQQQTPTHPQQPQPALSPFSDHYANNHATYFEPVTPQGVGPLDVDVDVDVDDHPIYGQVITDPFSSATSSTSSLSDAADNEESILMNAMLQREEMAIKAPSSPPPRSASTQELPSSSSTVALADIGRPLALPSHLTSTATILSNLNTTSTASNISGDVNKLADLSLSPSPPVTIPPSYRSPSVLNITIDAGAMPTASTPPSVAPNAKERSSATSTVLTSSAPESNPASGSTLLKSATGAPQLPPLDRMSISL